MLLIEDKLIDQKIAEKQFVCNLEACKGVCCVEGEGGAPLENDEIVFLEENLEKIFPYLTEEGKAVLREKGVYTVNTEDEYKHKTPLVEGRACAFVNYAEGKTFCGIEKAQEDGVIDFQKPISCHLYPIRAERGKFGKREYLRFDEWEICDPACSFGKELNVSVHEFLKDPLIRKYGEDFYEALDATIAYINEK